MNVFLADALFTPEGVLRDHGIVFEERIIEIAPNATLREHYPNAIDLGEGSVLMSGLINAHVHLEFSANQSTLTYGAFMPWLHSVIAHRDDLIHQCDEGCIEHAIKTMLSHGITAFGAISSYGFDLSAAFEAPQKVVYFNELIGSDPAMVDALYGHFLDRLHTSMQMQREGFYPAIAIHSPYSIHPILLRKALAYAHQHAMRVSTHFMESAAERAWIDRDEGDFAPFFETFLRQQRATQRSEDFIRAFDQTPALFVHGGYATAQEKDDLMAHAHTLVHCPISNRLLGNTLHTPLPDRWVLATDGLSSHYQLNLFEEMKIALMLHHERDLLPWAYALWRSVTSDAADALGLHCGRLQPHYDADLLITHVEYPITEQLPIHLILTPPRIDRIYIRGTLIQGDTSYDDPHS